VTGTGPGWSRHRSGHPFLWEQHDGQYSGGRCSSACRFHELAGLRDLGGGARVPRGAAVVSPQRRSFTGRHATPEGVSVATTYQRVHPPTDFLRWDPEPVGRRPEVRARSACTISSGTGGSGPRRVPSFDGFCVPSIPKV
jgi:hypothetical protein